MLVKSINRQARIKYEKNIKKRPFGVFFMAEKGYRVR